MQGFTRTFSATPTVDTNAYAAGDLIGTKMEFDVSALRDTNAIYLQSVQIKDLAKQNAAIDLVLFGSDPSGTTFTDNAAFDPADADMAKIIAVVSVTDYFAFNDNSVGRAENLAIPLNLAKTPDMVIYGALVSRGTPTFAAATDVTVTLGLAG